MSFRLRHFFLVRLAVLAVLRRWKDQLRQPKTLVAVLALAYLASSGLLRVTKGLLDRGPEASRWFFEIVVALALISGTRTWLGREIVSHN